MAEKNVLLSIENLSVKFRVRGRVLTAIRNVSLDIYENESIAIVGESGSGKSVFTKTFAGMLDSNGFVDEGNIIFNDETLSDTTVKLSSGARSRQAERGRQAGAGRGDLSENPGAGIQAAGEEQPQRRGGRQGGAGTAGHHCPPHRLI